MIYLDLLTQCARSHASISVRRRWPVAFRCEAQAVAQGIALLQQHDEAVGFILVPAHLQAANDAYLHERTITRAIAARKARKPRLKQRDREVMS